MLPYTVNVGDIGDLGPIALKAEDRKSPASEVFVAWLWNTAKAKYHLDTCLCLDTEDTDQGIKRLTAYRQGLIGPVLVLFYEYVVGESKSQIEVGLVHGPMLTFFSSGALLKLYSPSTGPATSLIVQKVGSRSR